MKYFRFTLTTGGFEYARDHGDGLGNADYFDDNLGVWVPSDYLHSEINNNGSWISVTEDEVLAATGSATSLAG